MSFATIGIRLTNSGANYAADVSVTASVVFDPANQVFIVAPLATTPLKATPEGAQTSVSAVPPSAPNDQFAEDEDGLVFNEV
ncbi:Hypothetical protein, putative [Bodo saltans]|uniref:Uncharacterized protein n=1 Tax=Bodo saltans TaxID=75058 RepID=A0A0S4JKZ3_BODSA|nr:Hypothetical protein, putative [Bodo saltans]|eukprot:CUG89865.1 Hypothetical protein, putative [Bodo saltans]